MLCDEWLCFFASFYWYFIARNGFLIPSDTKLNATVMPLNCGRKNKYANQLNYQQFNIRESLLLRYNIEHTFR